MKEVITSYTRNYVLGNRLGAGDFGICYLSDIPEKYPVAVKVFQSHASSQKELDIAQKVCSHKFKGLAVLEDFGIIDDEDVAENLEALPNSIFIVYKRVEYCLKDLYRIPGYFSK